MLVAGAMLPPSPLGATAATVLCLGVLWNTVASTTALAVGWKYSDPNDLNGGAAIYDIHNDMEPLSAGTLNEEPNEPESPVYAALKEVVREMLSRHSHHQTSKRAGRADLSIAQQYKCWFCMRNLHICDPVSACYPMLHGGRR